jgi:hypothetical protein
MSPTYHEVKPIEYKDANHHVCEIMATQNIESQVQKEIIKKNVVGFHYF